jgi:hypothetical protein
MTMLLTAPFLDSRGGHVVFAGAFIPRFRVGIGRQRNYLSDRRNRIVKRISLFHGRPERRDSVRKLWKRPRTLTNKGAI